MFTGVPTASCFLSPKGTPKEVKTSHQQQPGHRRQWGTARSKTADVQFISVLRSPNAFLKFGHSRSSSGTTRSIFGVEIPTRKQAVDISTSLTISGIFILNKESVILYKATQTGPLPNLATFWISLSHFLAPSQDSAAVKSCLRSLQVIQNVNTILLVLIMTITWPRVSIKAMLSLPSHTYRSVPPAPPHPLHSEHRVILYHWRAQVQSCPHLGNPHDAKSPFSPGLLIRL